MKNAAVVLVALAGLGAAACSSSEERASPVMPSRVPDLATMLAADTGVEWVVTKNQELGTPSFVEPKGKGPVELAPGAAAEPAAEAAARRWLAKYAAAFGMTSATDELELEAVHRSTTLGYVDVAFRQITRGVHVDGTRLTVHFDREGRIGFVNSTFAPRARDVDTSPRVDATAADRAAAIAFAKKPSSGTPAPELLVDARARRLVWRVSLSARPGDSMTFDVDAMAGTVVASSSAMRDATSTFRAQGNRGPHDIEIDIPSAGPPYELSRISGGVRPTLRCLDYRKQLVGAAVFLSDDGTTWDAAPGDADPHAAVDAYANLSLVEAWYRTQLRHDSYDGLGSAVLIYMHAPGPWNAGWDPSRREIVVFDGPEPFGFKTHSPAAAVDVVGHEFQHGVTGHLLRLARDGQAGAIDESLSDVFASMVEQATGTGDPHFFAENALSVPLRSVQEPTSRVIHRGVDRMSDLESGTDPHKASGIGNKAFTLFTESGRHQTTLVTVAPPAGWATARDVYWQVVSGRAIGPNATYEELALAHINVARSVSDDVGRAAICAWRAVEVIDDQATLSRWGVACAPHQSCLERGALGEDACGEGKRCEWNGEPTGYCCRTPVPGNEDLCVSDADCASGKICSYGRDNLLMCQDPEPGDDSCQRPPRR